MAGLRPGQKLTSMGGIKGCLDVHGKQYLLTMQKRLIINMITPTSDKICFFSRCDNDCSEGDDCEDLLSIITTMPLFTTLAFGRVFVITSVS